MSDKIRNNQKWIILALLTGFMIINYYIVFISIKPFQGFTVSGHPIFLMVPFAFASYVCFGLALCSGLMYLTWKTGEKVFNLTSRYDLNSILDLFLVSCAQVGVILGGITIIIGMIWAKVEWGAFWDWNPRETITLVMWLAYVSLLIFRDMLEVDNHERRATISAFFSILAFVSVPLSYVIVGIIHPNPQETSYSTGAGMFLMINFAFIGGLAIYLIYQAYKLNRIDFELKRIRKVRMEEA
ncbi:MAG: cytochrome c biogenesis protein CcsA [Candidatus Hodarchaeales archaeon]|jgi:heme exporter protein C